MNNLNTMFQSHIQMAIEYSPKLVFGIASVVVGFWFITRLKEYIYLTLKKAKTEETICLFLSNMAALALKGMLLLSVAGLFGIHTASFIAIFTALAFAIGTALSGNIGHFASGIMLLIFRPYKIGDQIMVQGNNGRVMEIHVFNTSILTLDNRKIIIPNGVITSGIITNFSHQSRIQLDVNFIVTNDTDFNNAKVLIQKVNEKCPIVLKDAKCDIFITGATKNGLEICARPWTLPENAKPLHAYFQENVREAFLNSGIQVPR